MTAIEFIAQYFRERKALIAEQKKRGAPHRQKYFAPNCVWGSRRRTVTEKILEVSEVGDETLVVTSGQQGFPMRYHLRRKRKGWLIYRVEDDCLCCHGTGTCSFCHGKGWR